MNSDNNINIKLKEAYNNFKTNKNTINKLFENNIKNNINRAENFSISDLGIHLDYSKNWLDDNILNLLCKKADNINLDKKIDDLFSGKKINITENRPALHTALRDINNLTKEIKQVHNKIHDLTTKLHSNKLLGFSNKPINTVVNIGIGGSDLGPKMVCNALKNYHNKNITTYFVSNIDPNDINNILNKINLETSLFIISSKSFSTIETLTNFKTIRELYLQQTEAKHLHKHFIAITSNTNKAIEYNISPDNILPMWDWVGGRYSLWSAIGISIAMATSYDIFLELLTGAHKLDLHFKTKSWQENIPVILALISTGYINYANCQTHAILPYCQDLEFFTNYIQQLDMESNGKNIDLNNNLINYNTGPVIWGAPGTNGQHAFHQLLHQSNTIVPCDFIITAKHNINTNNKELKNFYNKQQELLLSNALAQSKTLMDGYIDNINNKNYKFLAGNKPSNTILLPKLTPYYLGILIAIYEHKVFTQGILWNINSFDQWGVERGKIIANDILPYLEYNCNNRPNKLDNSTAVLINKYHNINNEI